MCAKSFIVLIISNIVFWRCCKSVKIFYMHCKDSLQLAFIHILFYNSNSDMSILFDN